MDNSNTVQANRPSAGNNEEDSSDDDNDLKRRVKQWLQSSTSAAFRHRFQSRVDEIGFSDNTDNIVYLLCLDTAERRSKFNSIPADLEREIFQGKVPGDEYAFLKLVHKKDIVKLFLNGWKSGIPSAPLRRWENHFFSTNSWYEDYHLLNSTFKTPFRGPGVDRLNRALDGYQIQYDPSRHYGRMVYMVQSSGTGKSRVVDELGKRRYLLTVSFRDIANRGYDPSIGWPPHDFHVCRFLQDDVPKDFRRKYHGEEVAGALLGALMEVIADQLPRFSTPQEFWTAWRVMIPDDMDQPNKSFREFCFKAIRGIAMTNLQSNFDTLMKQRGLMPSSGSGKATNEAMFDHDREKRESWYESIYETLIKGHAERIESICSEQPFIIAFNKCAELDLTIYNAGPQSEMNLLALQRMTSQASKKHNIWFIFMDANPGIMHVLPQSEKAAASFDIKRTFLPLPGLTYNSLDDMQSEAGKPPTPRAALSIKYLRLWGRPFWSTSYLYDLLDLAGNKLLCSRNLDVRSNEAVFSIFSARIPLDLRQSNAGNSLATISVRKHMRLLASMTSDVGLETFSPTEPILAVAAAGLLFASNDYQTALDQFIRELVLQDIVMDKDGRLAAFIVLMMARDFAIPSESEDSTKRLFVDSKNKNIPAVKVVKLDKFLQLLLGDSLGINTTSTNSTDSLEEVRNNLLTWASSHYLNFTHFVQFEKHIDEVTSDFLRVCWNRGAAVVCASKQRIYDILLVTYHGDLDGPTDPKKFGLVAIHVKIKASGWDRMPITGLTCPPVMDDVEDDEEEEVDCWKPEHLVIRMDLGNKIPFEKDNERYCDIGYEKAQKPEISRFEQPWRGYLDDEEERYVINVRGHDRGQYPLMDKTGLHEVLEKAIPPFQKIAGLWEDSLYRLHFGPSTRSSNPFM